MLVPAAVYKDQIEKMSDYLRYSDKMMFYNGCTETGRIQIQTDPTEGRYQWAILAKRRRAEDQDELVGYISYMVDYYSSNAYGFGLISFTSDKRYKRAIATGILEAIRHVNSLNLHRIEWRCVADNPAKVKYIGIMNKLDGEPHMCRLLDVFKDAYGQYHDMDIFEIIRNN